MVSKGMHVHFLCHICLCSEYCVSKQKKRPSLHGMLMHIWRWIYVRFGEGGGRGIEQLSMPNHGLHQLGEFMLYDFHQQKERVAITEDFHNSSTRSHKGLAQQSPLSSQRFVFLFLFLLLLLKTFCQYFLSLCCRSCVGWCVRWSVLR